MAQTPSGMSIAGLCFALVVGSTPTSYLLPFPFVSFPCQVCPASLVWGSLPAASCSPMLSADNLVASPGLVWFPFNFADLLAKYFLVISRQLCILILAPPHHLPHRSHYFFLNFLQIRSQEFFQRHNITFLVSLVLFLLLAFYPTALSFLPSDTEAFVFLL